MTTEYLYKIKVKNNTPVVALTLRTERTFVLGQAEADLLSRLDTGDTESRKLWQNAFLELARVLESLNGIPLDRVVGLRSEWAELPETMLDDVLKTLDRVTSNTINVLVEGKRPDYSIVFTMGSSTASFPFRAADIPVALTELNEVIQAVEDCQKQQKTHDETAKVIKDIVQVGKTTVAVVKCALAIAVAVETEGLGAPAALSACKDAVESVQELEKVATAPTTPAASDAANRSGNEVRGDTCQGNYGNETRNAVEHMYDA